MVLLGSAPNVILPVANPRPFCSVPCDRIWIDSEHAIAADAPAAEGHRVATSIAHSARSHAAPRTASTYRAVPSARSTQAPHHSRCSSSAASSAFVLHHAQVVTLQIVIVDMAGKVTVDLGNDLCCPLLSGRQVAGIAVLCCNPPN